MNDLDVTEERGFMAELKNQVQLYFLYRRYQKMKAGQLPWEDKLITIFERSSLKRSFDAIRIKAIASWRSILKRSLDIVVSMVGVILSFPIMALIAVAIKLNSNGPIFYKQTRVGLRGKLFNMFKFRTMYQDAEVKTGPVWAKENDSRITLVGKFLRKTHLDELPQFFNVLHGEMSLVGPRPERPYFVHEFRKTIPHYDRRLCVKPGVTGLAQIKRRYDESIADVKKKVRYDVLYIRKMCPVLDFMVLGLTAKSVFLGTGR
jgi:exopolysaccharide biosynthesis polyprenyl glycosylphosphotransferase